MVVDVRVNLDEMTPEQRELYEKIRKLCMESRAGDGVEIFDDWNELAPDWLNRCTVPDPKSRKG